MADIDIGSAAIDRNTYGTPGYTWIYNDNPANASGSITSVEIFAVSGYDLSDFEVAIFYIVSGANMSTRDYETIGSVTGGSKQTFSGLDMDVETGDFIGGYWSAGRLELGNASGVTYYYLSGDNIPCTDLTFSYASNYTGSIYGEGEVGGGVTEKSSSDSGSGVDAKVSGNPVATLAKTDTGSGADILSQAQAILDASETGSGVDAVDSLQTPEAKSSSDAGSGIEGIPVPSAFLVGSETGSGLEGTPVPSAFLVGSETGSGIEALISRLLATPDTGAGAEASSIEIDGVLKELFASELGRGSDYLAAKIEMPTKGGGMKLWT